MVLYRRNRIAGGRYFFTVTLKDRKSAWLVEHIGLLREAVRKTRLAKPFVIEAWQFAGTYACDMDTAARRLELFRTLALN